jgi:hypothetical protein
VFHGSTSRPSRPGASINRRPLNRRKPIAYYGAGHDVHPIQAKLALEDPSLIRTVTVVNIAEDRVTVRDGTRTTTYLCMHAPRLAALVASGRCTPGAGGGTTALLCPRSVLVVPARRVDARTFPHRELVVPNVAEISEGGATASPGLHGDWHLFSISLLDEEADAAG